MIPPTATYRLQLNKDFPFANAIALVPYLDALGISHVYLSPILKAQPGSTHGYDTVDHTLINPELGSLDDFRALAAALQARQMGIVLDFVPNHMGVGGADNGIWLDVLKHGPTSRYADWFDIDWQATRPGMAGKLLLPFLGASYAEALAAGDLRLAADGDGFAIWAYDKEKMPVRPGDARALLSRYGSADAAIAALTGKQGQAGSWDELDALMATQHWRLAHFSVAADEINYRRFFINSELAGVRIDQLEVFEHVHGLIFKLIDEGLIDGLRIDHVDGLRDPTGYLQMLRARAPRPIYLVVEKILAAHEAIRADWQVEGTTGYEVGTQLTRVLMQAGAETAVTQTYADFICGLTDWEEESHRCRLRVMDHELAAELDALAGRMGSLAWSDVATGDLTEAGLRRALRAVMARLKVYRTYIDQDGAAAGDRREISEAVERARRDQTHIQPSYFDFVVSVLCGERGADADEVIGKFQQLSGPVMAKGVEDTALYRFNRLVALNEVGADPDHFAMSVAAFHDSNKRRLATHPHCMIATSTHDTKRGEDIRAIIAAIADEPELWRRAVDEWRTLLVPCGADVIHRNDLYLFFQLLLGGWPMRGEPEGLGPRLHAAMVKSLREARERSDWAVNNAVYEQRLERFIEAALVHAPFLASFHAVREPLQDIGRRTGLIQAAIKLMIPGVPDIYRGAEDWEQSFVDPDNRRPLDFEALAQRLADAQGDGNEKLALTQSLLRLRRQHPSLFASGHYEALDFGTEKLGFRRRDGGEEVMVLADLSKGHRAGLDIPQGYETVVGFAADPVWVGLRDTTRN